MAVEVSTKRRPVAKFLRDYSSLGFAVAAMALFLSTLWLLPVDDSAIGRQMVAEFVRLYGYTGSNDQRHAHLIAVLALAVVSAFSFILGRRGEAAVLAPRLAPPLGITACLVLTAIFLVAYLFVALPSVVACATLLTVLFLLLLMRAPHLRAPSVERALTALIGAYLALLIVPGLLVSPIPLLESGPDVLAQLETHLLWLPMRGSAVAAGQQFFREVPIGYGLLMPSIMSVVDVRLQELSIAGQLRFIQAGQILFCLFAACAYLAYRPRNYLGVLAALLLAGPYWASAGLGIWHPNQTGFRSLGLPAGMLALMLAGRLPPARAAWWLGMVAAAAALMNVETAVAVIAGFCIFLSVRTRTIPLRLFARAAIAAVLTAAAYMVLYRVTLGRNPFSFGSIDLFAFIARAAGGGWGSRLFSAGYEGEGYYVVPFALLMFGHAVYVVIDGFRRLGTGALPPRGALRVSVAVTLIAWLAYYFNSPNWWQIWTHLFLYGFLVMDLIDRRRFGIGAARGARSFARLARVRIRPAILVLLLFLALLIPHTNRHLVKYMSGFMYPRWLRETQELTVLSGILMPRELAAPLEKKATKLKELHAAAQGRLLYFTFNMAFMPQLTRIFQPPPYRDMFGEIAGDAAFEKVMGDLLKAPQDVILIDAPAGPLAVSGPRKDYQDRIRAAIGPAYRLAGTQDGWQIWRLAGRTSSSVK